MTRSPAVSVVMPVLRPHPTYFLQAVESVLAQTMGDLELVIVEDPSEVHAGDLLASFADERIRHVRNKERTSLPDQLNVGLQHATSHLVARFDADDICEPHRLEVQSTELAARPDVGVLGSFITIIDQSSRSIGYRAYPIDHDAIFRSFARFNALAHPSVMYRKELALAAGGYTYKKYPAVEDYDLWSRLAHRGVVFRNHPEPLIRYRIHPGAMKVTDLRGINRGIVDIKRIYWTDAMALADRVRLLAEQALLFLPPRLVLKLFMRWHYRERLVEER